MKNLIATFRLPIVLIAVFMGVAGFVINRLAVPILIPVFILVFGAATMSHNDWRDRFHDTRKGKNFAQENPNRLLLAVILLWVLTVYLAWKLYEIQVWFGVLSFISIVLGITYSEARKVPLLSGILVAITAVIPILYSLVEKFSWLSMFLAAATFFFIWGREILKDIEDLHIDTGYKATLPVLAGSKSSKIIVGILYMAALVALVQVSIYTLVVVPFLLKAIGHLLANQSHEPAKRFGDIAMVLATLLLLVPAL